MSRRAKNRPDHGLSMGGFGVFFMSVTGGFITMNKLVTASTLLIIAGIGLGCAHDPARMGSGEIVAAEDPGTLPPDVYPAVIWVIDGKRVRAGRSVHRLTPGNHSLAVLPRQDGPLRTTVEWAATAQSRGINIVDMDVTIQDGQRIVLGAILRRHRVYTHENGQRVPLGPVETSVVPVVVSAEHSVGLLANTP